MNKTCIIIAGPTASGKTALAIELASHFQTDIISADSRQCYRELGVGVAKPSQADLEKVTHHFIDSHSIQEEVTAAAYEQYALDKAAFIFSKRDVVVMVGGTGLYIRAFVAGLDPVPAVDAGIRAKVIKGYHEAGLEWLQERIRQLDPLFARLGEMQNPQRIMRALEVIMSSGMSIFSFRNTPKPARPFRIIQVMPDLPREILYERINQRVDVMMANGLLEEARRLYPMRHLNALQTVGYREFFELFDDGSNDPAAISKTVERIKQNTRHYAKRQLTWFRKEEGIIGFNPEKENVLDLAMRCM